MSEKEQAIFSKIPQGWQLVRLEEVVQSRDGLKRGPWGGAIKKEIFVPSGYKVYEQQNVIRSDFSLGHYFTLSLHFLIR